MKKVYCKNCFRWQGRNKADSCQIRDNFGYSKNKDWFSDNLAQAIGLERPEVDMGALRFLQTKKITLENDMYSRKYLAGVPSLLNKSNDCYFFEPHLRYWFSKGIIGEFRKHNLLINGFKGIRGRKQK